MPIQSKAVACARLALGLLLGAAFNAGAAVIQVPENTGYFNGWVYSTNGVPSGTKITPAAPMTTAMLGTLPFTVSIAASPTPSTNNDTEFFNANNVAQVPAGTGLKSGGTDWWEIGIGVATVTVTTPFPQGTALFMHDFDGYSAALGYGEQVDFQAYDCGGNLLDISGFDFLQISTTAALGNQPVFTQPSTTLWHFAAQSGADNGLSAVVFNSTQVCSIKTTSTRSGGGTVDFFIATPPTQSLVVTKTVMGAPEGYSDNFAITVACTLGGNDVSGQLTPGGTQTVIAGTGADGVVTFANVPQGATCSVTEDALPAAPANYAWSADSPTIDPTSVTIGTSAASATVTNTLQRQSSTIDLTKTVTGGPSGGISGTFTFAADCGTDGAFTGTVVLTNATSGTGSIADVPAGAACMVSEAAIPAAPTNYQWGTTPAAASVTTTVAGPNTAAFTNTLTQQTSDLVVTKTVSGGPSEGVTATFGFTADCGTEGTFTGTVALANATTGTTTISGVPAGSTCSVSETTIPAAPTWYQWGTAPSAVSVTTTVVGPNTASFTNTLTAVDPPFTLTKTVSGGPAGGISGTFAFTIDCGAVGVFTQSVTLTNATSGSVTISNIPGGTSCTFSESPGLPAAPGGFTWGGLPAAQTRTIDGTNVAFVNSLNAAQAPVSAVPAPSLSGWALLLLGWVTALAGAFGMRNHVARKRSE